MTSRTANQKAAPVTTGAGEHDPSAALSPRCRAVCPSACRGPLVEAAGGGKDRRCPQFCRPVFASLAADKIGSPPARSAARKSASLPPPTAPPRKRAHADGQAARRRTGKPLMQTNTLSIAPAITDTAA